MIIVRLALFFLAIFDAACNVCQKVSSTVQKGRRALMHLFFAKTTTVG